MALVAATFTVARGCTVRSPCTIHMAPFLREGITHPKELLTQADDTISRSGRSLETREIGMKISTCLPLALRILPSAPLASKRRIMGGLPPCPPRMGCRPYEPRYFIPRWRPQGMNDCFGLPRRNGKAIRLNPPDDRQLMTDSWRLMADS